MVKGGRIEKKRIVWKRNKGVKVKALVEDVLNRDA